jgi:signal transduction histidine kinase/ligand-binding sensor domain-containing protein
MSSPSIGTFRFDSRNLRKYRPEEIETSYFKSSQSSLIFEDSKKNLWMGTSAGALMRYDRMLDRFQAINDSSTSIKKQLKCQVEDSTGAFWIGTAGGGLLRFHPETKSYFRYQSIANDPNSIPDNYVMSLVFDHTGTLWVGTTSGLCRYDAKYDQFIRLPLINKNPADTYRYRVIRHLLLSSNHELIISTYGGLHIIDLNSGLQKHFLHNELNSKSLSHNSLFQSTEAPDGTIWLATYGGGLNLYNPKTGKFSYWKKDETEPNGISSNNLFSVYLDRDGLLWIGADDGHVGIHNTLSKRFHSILHKPSQPQSISSGWARVIFQENDSIYWIGFNGEGLNRLNLKTGVAKKFQHDPKKINSLGHNVLVAIDQDSQKSLWLGLEGGGINMLNPMTDEFIRYETGGKNSISNNAVSAMIVDQDDFLWATTYRSGLSVFDINQKKFKNINDDSIKKASGVSFESTRQIYELNKTIWFNTPTQAVVFDKERNRFVSILKEEGQLATTAGTSLLEMQPYSETEMLLITNNKIKKLRYTSLEKIEETILLEKPKGEEGIKSFVVDSHNQLWGITKNQLMKWSLKDGIKRYYNTDDGLLPSNLQSLTIDNKDRIILSTLDGINWFFPDEIKEDTVGRKIVFTDFKIYNKSVSIGNVDTITTYSLPGHISQIKKVTLNHNQSFFSIEFTTLEFMSPNKIEYAYKLDGFDKDWVNVGNQNFASYTNLDPGQYTFHAKATNPDGLWGSSVASISIIINPPFWQTWWFVSLSVLAIGALINAVHHYRLSQSLKVERIRNKIASDLHDEVGSSLTRISIYSELLQNNSPEGERLNYLSRISSMSREIVSTMSDIVWSIDNRSDTAGALLMRMKDFANELLQPKNITYDFRVSGINEKAIVDPLIRQNIYLLFKEAINNMAKHAHATNVVIKITNDSKKIKMILSDNGKGFDIAKDFNGNGLKNMERRAKAIQGDLQFVFHQGTQVIFTGKSI